MSTMDDSKDMLLFNDIDSAGLRKRTVGKVIRSRDRSLSPNASSTDKKWVSPAGPMHEFQDTLKLEFPEIVFTDEFCETESGTTTCLISGLTCGLDDLTKYNKLPFDLKFEDGRLCLTHTSGTIVEVAIKKAKISKRQFAIIVLWIISISVTLYLMTIFREKYNELM